MPNLIIELKEFLEMTQFYRQFVKDYADVVKLMYDILKDNAFEYQSKKQQVLFDTLKEKLITTSIRTYLNFNKLFKLYTNALNIGLEAVLA